MNATALPLFRQAASASIRSIRRPTIPPGLSDEFGSDPTASRRWREFLERMRVVNEPTDFAAVVRAVRENLWPTIIAAGSRS